MDIAQHEKASFIVAGLHMPFDKMSPDSMMVIYTCDVEMSPPTYTTMLTSLQQPQKSAHASKKHPFAGAFSEPQPEDDPVELMLA